MMAEQKFFFILLLSGLCCLAIAPLFLFRNSERNSVSLTAPGLMVIGIAFVLIGCCGFVGLDSYGGRNQNDFLFFIKSTSNCWKNFFILGRNSKAFSFGGIT